ncbi:MAG: oligosaccharide flippase family protein [Solirubrobacterales bacterium]|nr:oligosaccharide flippase family protein [Solirubrobacterales bacterium]
MNDGGDGRGGLTGTVIRGVSLAGGGFLLGRVITLITFVVLARLVTPEELGQYTSGSVLVGFGLLLAGSGMLAALVHREDRIDEAASTATVATIGAGVILAALAVAVAPLIAAFFGSRTVGEVAAVSAGILFLQSARTVPNAILQRRFSFLRRLIVEPASILAFGIASIIATSQGLGVWGLVIGMYAQAVVDVALSWGLVQWRPRWRLVSFPMWRELVGYGRHVLAGTAIRRVGDQVPVFVAGGMLNQSSVGQLQYANRIVTTPYSLLVAGISYVVFPAFARIATDRERFKPALLRTLRWSSVVAMPMGLILAPLGEPLAVLVFGDRWSVAGQVTAAVCLFIPAQTIAAEIGEGFKGTGIPAKRTRVNAIGVFTGAAAMLALTPLIGLYGVGVGISVDATAGAAVAILLARGAMGIPVRAFLAAIAPAAAAAVVMIAVLFPLENLIVNAADRGTVLGLLLLTAEGLAGVAVYLLGLRLLAPGLGGELLGLVRVARQRPGKAVDVEGDEELLEDEGEPMLPG